MATLQLQIIPKNLIKIYQSCEIGFETPSFRNPVIIFPIPFNFVVVYFVSENNFGSGGVNWNLVSPHGQPNNAELLFIQY